MSKRKRSNKIPDLCAENDRIELDQISLLVEEIHKVFTSVYGVAADPNEWDSCRIREEMEDCFTAHEFNRLFSTELGRGILVGVWTERWVMNDDETELETDRP